MKKLIICAFFLSLVGEVAYSVEFQNDVEWVTFSVYSDDLKGLPKYVKVEMGEKRTFDLIPMINELKERLSPRKTETSIKIDVVTILKRTMHCATFKITKDSDAEKINKAIIITAKETDPEKRMYLLGGCKVVEVE